MTKPDKKDEGGEDLDVFEEWEAEGEEEAEDDEGFADDEGEGDFGPGEGPEDASEEGDLHDLPEGAEKPSAEVKAKKPAAAPQAPKAAAPKAVAVRAPAAARPAAPKKFDAAALDLAPDVPVQVIAVMGKRGMTIKELMELRMGQVIDLKRPPNETVDVVVNGKLFARGELVEIDGKLGVRILKLAK